LRYSLSECGSQSKREVEINEGTSGKHEELRKTRVHLRDTRRELEETMSILRGVTEAS
jgi:hypothetical protein